MVMVDFWHLINKVYDPEYLASATRTKVSVLVKVFDTIGIAPQTLLFASYTPLADAMADDFEVYLTPDQHASATNAKVKIAHANQKFDCVLAIDEHLTYFPNEQAQRDRLAELSKACDGWFITTLVDYKNLAPYKKNQVEVLHDYKSDAIFLEQNSPNNSDKQAWDSYFYAITDHKTLESIGPIPRRTMYFKQLAKYASDLGSKDYVVQKNTLYRGFGRKHWEHIITIRF
jgi:hypothetical protein